MAIRADVRPGFAWPLDEMPGAPAGLAEDRDLGREGGLGLGAPLTPVLGDPPRWPVAGWLITWAVKLAFAGLLTWCLWVAVAIAVTS